MVDTQDGLGSGERAGSSGAEIVTAETSAMRETLKHVHRVGDLLLSVVHELTHRAVHHDASKFGPVEFPVFAAETATLKGLTYGSEEYKAALVRMRPAIEAHYAGNRHHPEHHLGGIHMMTLIDLIEMLADWKAAGERHADGSLARSIILNAERFGYDGKFAAMLARTARQCGWATRDETNEVLAHFNIDKEHA